MTDVDAEAAILPRLQTQRTLAALRREVRDHPVLREYLRTSTGRTRQVTNAFDVMGERLVIAYAALSDDPSIRAGLIHWPTPEAGKEGQWATVFASAVLDAVPYLWLYEPMREAIDMPYPDHVLAPDVLPHRIVWFTFESPVTVSGRTSTGEVLSPGPSTGAMVEGEFSAAILTDVPAGGDHLPRGGLALTSITAWDDGDGETSWLATQTTVHPYGEPVAGGNDTTLTLCLKLLSFLASPFIPKEERRIDRRLRRSLERHPAQATETPPRIPIDSPVTVVDLRAAAPVAGAHRDGHGEPTGRHHKRHLVRGHHRAQWYPSISAHRVIWIRPHVRGSGDLIPTTYRVVR